MGTTKLSDLSILIPLRVDSISRLENIVSVVRFISSSFDVKIVILEADSRKNNFLNILLSGLVEYIFVEDHDPVFHRTKYINILVNHVNSNFVGIWDSDVVCSPIQIFSSLDMLRSNSVDIVYPYDRKFLDTSKVIRELFISTHDFRFLILNQRKMKEIYAPKPVGGAFFINRSEYISAGLENEYFYGWGVEDGERAARFSILGLRKDRISGPLFHLSHDRGFNSAFHSPAENIIKRNALFKVASMSREELLSYINLGGF